MWQGFVPGQCAQVLVNYDDLLAAQSRGDLITPNSRALIEIFDQDTVPVLCASAVVYYLFVQFLGYLKCGDIDRDYDDGEALLSGWELSQLEAAERYDTITNRLKTFANFRGKTVPRYVNRHHPYITCTLDPSSTCTPRRGSCINGQKP